jgi:hypothetical protein
MPARKHFQQFAFSPSGRVAVIRGNIRSRVPGESSMAGIENPEPLSASPGFTVTCRCDGGAMIGRETAPNYITTVNRLGSAEQFGPNTRSYPVGANDGVVLGRETRLKLKSDFAPELLQMFQLTVKPNAFGRERAPENGKQIGSANADRGHFEFSKSDVHQNSATFRAH